MINSLAAHVHICSKYSKTEGVGLAVRSQELSEASNGNGNIGPAGTLQGSEDNSALNSRSSPTNHKGSPMSSSQKKSEDVVSLASEKAEEEEVVNTELETIFENGSKRTLSLSQPP